MRQSSEHQPITGAGTTDSDQREARITWATIADPNDGEAHDFVADLGPIAALQQVRAGHGAPRWHPPAPDLARHPHQVTLSRLGARLLIPSDDEWPSGLDDLESQAPFCLWVRGPLNVAAATQRAAAITGARAGTPYGERIAADLAGGCATRGITVVASGAYGIEGAAHRGALAAHGPTLAILACGIDPVHPHGHQDLIGRIGENGALISEVPPGSGPNSTRSIARGRLMAALSDVTVVVECTNRSAAIDIACAAARLGRRTGAVPGPVTSPSSAGPHEILRQGGVCVTGPADLAALVPGTR